VKLIFENWRKFKNENNEKLQRLYDLTDDYPNIDYERLQDIAWQVHGMMYPRDATAIPIGIEDFDLEFEADEAEFAKRLFALNNELERKRGNNTVSESDDGGLALSAAKTMIDVAVKDKNQKNKGRRQILPGELQKLKDEFAPKLVGKRTIDAKKAIQDKIK